jgi:hypothetical protein
LAFVNFISFLFSWFSSSSSSSITNSPVAFPPPFSISLDYRNFCLMRLGIYFMKFFLQWFSYFSKSRLKVLYFWCLMKGVSFIFRSFELKKEFFLWKYVIETMISFILVYLKNIGNSCLAYSVLITLSSTGGISFF